MALTKLARASAQEAYLDTSHVLDKVVAAHTRRYGGDAEEYRSAADEWWMKAFERYDPALRDSFEAWVRTKAAMGMMEHHRREYVRNNLRPRKHRDLTNHPTAVPPEFDLDEFLEGLSEDAKMVVLLVLDTPIDVRLNLAQRGGDEPKNYRAALREFLGDLGWSFARVMASFREIKEYL